MNIEKCVLNITCESCIEIYSRDYLLDEIIKQWNDPDKQLEFLDWITKAGLRAFYICGRDAEIFDELFFLVGIVASKLTTAAKEKFLTPTTVKNLTVVWAYDKNVYDFIQNQIQGKPDYIVSEFLFLMYLYSYKNNML